MKQIHFFAIALVLGAGIGACAHGTRTSASRRDPAAVSFDASAEVTEGFKKKLESAGKDLVLWQSYLWEAIQAGVDPAAIVPDFKGAGRTRTIATCRTYLERATNQTKDIEQLSKAKPEGAFTETESAVTIQERKDTCVRDRERCSFATDEKFFNACVFE